MYFHSKKLAGFTNVEMLIVVVMVIALGALTISTFQKNSFMPKDELRKKDTKELARSLEEYKIDTGSYLDPYPGEACLGQNSYKVISTRNTTFRDALKSHFDPADLNLPLENYLYVVSCNLEDFSLVATLNGPVEDVIGKPFLEDFRATLSQPKRQNTYFQTQ